MKPVLFFMYKKIFGKKILFVVAHPDDESFLAAGTIYENKLAGGENYILCATKGERGFSYLKEKLLSAQLKKVRNTELLRVSKYLQVHKLKILNFPDGSLAQHFSKLKQSMERALFDCEPDYVISFGADGYTGHRDHVVIGKIAKMFARKHNIPFLIFTKPTHAICKNLDVHLVAKRKNGVYKEECEEFLQNTTEIMKIRIDPKVKLKALSLHKSQFEGLNPHNIFPKKVAEHVLRYEYFSF